MNKLWAVTRWLGHYSFSCVSSLFCISFLRTGFLLISIEIGVGDSALQWFASYLRGRRQRVVTRTSRGELYEAHRGVPQGSTLGPVLFNLSVRKLPPAASSSMVRQYADDVALYLAGRNLQQTTEELARDVCRIRDFLSERGLILNASKTQFIVFHSRSKKVCSSLRLTIDNVSIPPATTVKYLGMTFDQHLTFADHISALERKVGDKLAVFRRIRDRLTREPSTARSYRLNWSTVPMLFITVCRLGNKIA